MTKDLAKEMPKMPKLPKMPKVEVCLSPSCRLYEPEAGGSILLKEKSKVCYYIRLLISGFSC